MRSVMPMKQLHITVDFDKARENRIGAVNIASLVEAIPSAKIVAGNPTISVQVMVDEQHQTLLRNAVAKFCVVDEYVDLDLYGTAR
jgi:hypothetical protein